MIHDAEKHGRVTRETLEGGIVVVRLSRAEKRNALDRAMFDELIKTGEALAQMPGLRCVILTGDGNAFSAGLDLSYMQHLLAGTKAAPLAARSHGTSNHFQRAATVWRDLPVPVIAAVHGICLGGALQIIAGADVRIVAPDARLSVMEIRWGIIPDMNHFVPWRGSVRDDVLRELTYTAREFSGVEALALGFATMLEADPVTRALALANAIAERNPDAVKAAKRLFNAAPGMSATDMLLAESVAQDQLLGTPNQLEAVASQLEKRAPNYR